MMNRYKWITVVFVALVLCVDILTIGNVGNKVAGKIKNYRDGKVTQNQEMRSTDGRSAQVSANHEASLDQKSKEKLEIFKKKVNDNLAGKLFFVSLNGEIQEIFGKRIVEDADQSSTVVKLNNGYLTFLPKHKNTTEIASATIQLKNVLAKQGIPLFYIQAPFKINKYDPQLPAGLEDGVNRNADEFLAAIAGQVNYLDLREEIRRDGLDHYALFFRTDHHWKPEAAFWAYGKIRRILQDTYGFLIDPSKGEADNYGYHTYESYFLGSEGKRTGLYYAGTDDIRLIYPQYDTNFDFEIPSKNLKRTGDFLHAFIEYEQIEERDYFGKNPYAMYTGGDFPLNIIRNNRSDNDKKIVLVRDSFSVALAPFLALDCKELHIVDLRHLKHISLIDYIEAVKPDLVLIEYNPGAYAGKDAQTFFSYGIQEKTGS